MKKIITFTLIILLTPTLLFSDISNGKELYTKGNCQQCHGFGEEFDRYKNKMKDLDHLTQRIAGCANHFKVNWDSLEVEDVTEYLNTTQYKFKH